MSEFVKSGVVGGFKDCDPAAKSAVGTIESVPLQESTSANQQSEIAKCTLHIDPLHCCSSVVRDCRDH